MEVDARNRTIGRTFRVLSYNVNFAICRGGTAANHPHHRVLAAIRECMDYDVICLQETNHHWEVAIRKLLQDAFPFQQWHDPGAAGGSAILSRTPIRDVSLFYPANVKGSWFESMIATIEIQGSAVRFVNVHLRPPVNDDGSAYPWTYSATNPIRLAELKEITSFLNINSNSSERKSVENVKATAEVSPTKPPATIILGDFNESESAPGVKFLTKECGFADAVEQFVPSSQETHRWPILKGWYILKHRLDHIVYSRDSLQCNSCAVMTAYADASDHMPIRAQFTFL